MEINKDIQYNQGVGKYKVLSSNAGVGSIITTKVGFFVMPLATSNWGFIKRVNKQINIKSSDPNWKVQHLNNPNDIPTQAGVNIINDSRFLLFLKSLQGLSELIMFVDVPHLVLTDSKYAKEQDHPLYKKHYELTGFKLKAEDFTIPAIHFPRWFYSSKTRAFMCLENWRELWVKQQCNGGDLKYFSPPKDPNHITNRTFLDNGKSKDIYKPLIQVPLLLICKNGHMSDIPWYQLFCAGIEGKKKELNDENGFELFDYQCKECDKGGKHELKWNENKNSSESWGTLTCYKCKKTYSLEGIMNIKPFCKSETPWNGLGTRGDKLCKALNGTTGKMQVALATSNSVYYADSFSSLYIPDSYLNNFLSEKLQNLYNKLSNKWYPKQLIINPNLSKQEYWDNLDIKDKADDFNINLNDDDVECIKKQFFHEGESSGDVYEEYRYEEFSVFTNNCRSIEGSLKLEFEDIILPSSLLSYFKKIQQVNTLTLTLTQLGFSRVSLPTPKRIDGTVTRDDSQHIYSESVENLHVLPANQSSGEGIFFEFDMKAIEEWETSLSEDFKERYNQNKTDLGRELQDEMNQYGIYRFYLLHTFSHIIIKELEFSCGYPSASLQERLYYSDRMCGVLIFTADGSEGSMGGLVWQGQQRLVERIINSALLRARECSSDPLCWENENQLNLAACFSCALISETSCEHRNLGLDRRILVDPNWGFFKNKI